MPGTVESPRGNGALRARNSLFIIYLTPWFPAAMEDLCANTEDLYARSEDLCANMEDLYAKPEDLCANMEDLYARSEDLCANVEDLWFIMADVGITPEDMKPLVKTYEKSLDNTKTVTKIF